MSGNGSCFRSKSGSDGLTWVAFGTSAPELMISLGALWAHHADIIMGNAVGSNIANILLVMGFSALLLPGSGVSSSVRPQVYSLLGFTSLFVLASYNQAFGWYQGMVMVALLGVFFFWYIKRELRASPEKPVITEGTTELPWPFGQTLSGAFTAKRQRVLKFGFSLIYTFSGLIFLFLGAHFLIKGAASVALTMGVSEAVIGLSIIAIGTSLPELVTCIVASYRGHVGLAVGNIIGSNIFNLFGVVGITALVGTVPVPPEVRNIDIWVMAVATALIGVIMLTGTGIKRSWGAGFLVVYGAYMSHLWLR